MGNLLKVISSSSVLASFLDGVEELITGLIGPIYWGLCNIFFRIIDLFELLYKKFAGIEDFVVGKDTVNQDPVLYLINTDVVQEIFFSIVTLSMILLIIFTIFAIVKNIYAEKPKPLGEILRSMTKALLMYLLVPIATIVCLLVGNVVLRAIDGATKIGGASSTSDMLFMSAAYNASRLRNDNDAENEEEFKAMLRDGHLTPVSGSNSSPQYKKYISELSANGITLSGSSAEINYSTVNWEGVASAVDEAYLSGLIGGGDVWWFGSVRDYYYVLKINLITVWAGGVFIIFAMGKITWGLISRMFKMTVYYAISPALMAMFPIKGDSVLKSWTGEMVKNATMAYCAIGVLNVVFAVLPAFNQIKLFGNNFVFNGLAVLFIDIVALTSAEKLISTLSGWFGTGDALAEGKAAQSGAMKPTKAVVGKATGAFVGSIAGAKEAKALGMGKGKQFGAFLSGAMGGAGLKNPIAKHIQDSQKAGKEKFKEMDTTTLLGKLTGNVDKTKLAEYEGREKVAAEKKQLEELQAKYNAAQSAGDTDAMKKIAAQMAQLESVKFKTDDRRAELEKNEKKTTAQTENLGVFKQLEAAKQEVMAQAYQIFGHSASAAQIADLMSGNTSGLDPDQLDRWNENSGAFMSATNAFNTHKNEIDTRLATDSKFAAQASTAHLDRFYDRFGAMGDTYSRMVAREDRRLKVEVQANKTARDDFEFGAAADGIVKTTEKILDEKLKFLTTDDYKDIGKGKK